MHARLLRTQDAIENVDAGVVANVGQGLGPQLRKTAPNFALVKTLRITSAASASSESTTQRPQAPADLPASVRDRIAYPMRARHDRSHFRLPGCSSPYYQA